MTLTLLNLSDFIFGIFLAAKRIKSFRHLERKREFCSGSGIWRFKGMGVSQDSLQWQICKMQLQLLTKLKCELEPFGPISQCRAPSVSLFSSPSFSRTWKVKAEGGCFIPRRAGRACRHQGSSGCPSLPGQGKAAVGTSLGEPGGRDCVLTEHGGNWAAERNGHGQLCCCPEHLLQHILQSWALPEGRHRSFSMSSHSTS